MNRRPLACTALLCTIFALSFSSARAQGGFDIEAYRQFLRSNVGLGGADLGERYPSGTFMERGAGNRFDDALFSDSIDHYYSLTSHERSLIEKHGFMVTERLSYGDFGRAYLEIYTRDLPVYVSTDAILHALHMSYDAILMDLEASVLSPRLQAALDAYRSAMPQLEARYGGEPRMGPMLRDLDLYLTVPAILLSGDTTILPFYPENSPRVGELRGMIRAEQPALYKLFAETERFIDFSQFTPRGHYTQSPALTLYFQAMIWLGRTEFQLIAPENVTPAPTKADIQRQAIGAMLFAEASEAGNAGGAIAEMDAMLRVLVGESDNVTLPQLQGLIGEMGLKSATELLDDARLERFQTLLAEKAYAFQRINSQILMTGWSASEKLRPAAAFLPLGQRFIIDSYITGEVVFDKIIYNDQKIFRPLPSTLDILFALGNNAAAQFLTPELDRYHYAPNLSALRYLVDSYDDGFWNENFYNGWLSAIRTLNPPADRSGLPPFMRTAAWWQKKMNTQLASWAQLRHDNLLYAKQSYTGGATCSFPKSLVEPVPEFYNAIARLARNAAERFEKMPGVGSSTRIVNYFQRMERTMDTLGGIARKELASTPLTPEEELFLKTMLYETPSGCTMTMEGWYPHLFYTHESGLKKEDLVVADVHTAPTDEMGTMVGWVLHGGTGRLNMAVVTCTTPDGKSVAYIGPVASYYEHVSTGFKRLTDEEWETVHAQAPSFRPSFVNLYLAGKDGEPKGGEVLSLRTGTSSVATTALPGGSQLTLNYPNPFDKSTLLGFTVAPAQGGSQAVVAIYDVTGNQVRMLLREKLPAGNYTVRWDGTGEQGAPVPAGTYFARLTVDGVVSSNRITFLGAAK